MPRKRSAGGRKRTVLTTNYLLERANKRLINLEKANLGGKYASKQLIQGLQGQKSVKIGSRKLKNRIKVIKKLNINDKRFIDKRLKQFLRAETSTPTGVKQVRENTRRGLEKMLNRTLTDEDLDDIFTLMHDPQYNYFKEKIGYEKVISLVDEAKQKNVKDVNGFIEMLKSHMTVNSKETRELATKLYNKFVKE
jgi:hypothetical protein